MKTLQYCTVLHAEAPSSQAHERTVTLRQCGAVVWRAQTAAEALTIAPQYHVVVIHRDIDCPEMACARTLRTLRSQVGIIVLATRWEPTQRRAAMADFADDCLDDTTGAVDLEARVIALHRRALRGASDPFTVRWGPLSLDFITGVVTVDGCDVPLQPLQLRILGYLVQRAERLVTREELRQKVFRVAQGQSSTSIPRQMSALRKQLGARRNLVVTEVGGYRLASDDRVTFESEHSR